MTTTLTDSAAYKTEIETEHTETEYTASVTTDHDSNENENDNTGFKALGLAPFLLNALDEMGFEKPSSIQSEAIPVLLGGKDVIGQAQTGSGKTAAFAIPAIQSLDPAVRQIQALVLCPTRELAVQVGEQFRLLLQCQKKFFVTTVYGGEDIRHQLRALKKQPSIIVGTPGRTMDLMERGAIDISEARMVVLDEADEMLDMGFREDIETILTEAVHEDRQTVLFSATMEADILRLAKTFQNSPVVIDVSDQQVSQPKIEHHYCVVPEQYRMEAVYRLLIANNTRCGVVFCNTKAKVDNLVEFLRSKNVPTEGLHGDLNQNARTRIMHAFRSGHFNVLVATDVAGRGMDVNNLEVVVNCDLPRDKEDYVHRVGRTGRAGKTGKAYSLVSARQSFVIKKLERMYGLDIQQAQVPTAADLEQADYRYIMEQLREGLDPEKASERKPYIKKIKRLTANGIDAVDIAAVLFKLVQQSGAITVDASLDDVFTLPKEYDRPDSRRDKYGKSDRRSGKSFGKKGAFGKRKGKPEKSSSSSSPFKSKKSKGSYSSDFKRKGANGKSASNTNKSFKKSKKSGF